MTNSPPPKRGIIVCIPGFSSRSSNCTSPVFSVHADLLLVERELARGLKRLVVRQELIFCWKERKRAGQRSCQAGGRTGTDFLLEGTKESCMARGLVRLVVGQELTFFRRGQVYILAN